MTRRERLLLYELTQDLAANPIIVEIGKTKGRHGLVDFSLAVLVHIEEVTDLLPQ